MATKFAVGDVVQLKSGGPALTVLSSTAKEVVAFFFREYDGTFAEVTLPIVVLDKIDLSDDEDDEFEE